MKPLVKTVASQPSWVLRNAEVELAVTQLGGHMAPVTFFRNSRRPVRPYYVSPWQGEGVKVPAPILAPLRGDFFCMPFGADNRYRGEDHTCHGEPATKKWKFASAASAGGVRTLTLTMRTKMRPGNITKELSLVDGSPAVYVRHVLEGYSGPMTLGHHASLAVGDAPGGIRVATSPIRFGMTSVNLFSDPAEGEYSSLALGAKFRDLSRVPTLWKDPKFTDCTRFPAREGFADLLSVFNKKPAAGPAWTTATVAAQGYLWFSLKDPAVLPATTFWISNHGRHSSPWNGRNRCLGLEDGCGFFADGLHNAARKNRLNDLGVPTVVKLSPKRPTVINYVQGTVKIPRGFDVVEAVEFAPGKVTFLAASGKAVTAAVRHEFIESAELA